MKVLIGKYPKKADRERKVKIQIDKFDTYNMDHTVALIVLPMLQQLFHTKHGHPFVDPEDVPNHLRVGPTNTLDHESQLSLFQTPNECIYKTHERAWDWIMCEMIWTFENIIDEDSDACFFNHPSPDEYETWTERLQNIKVDNVGLNAHHQRIDNGLRLFGKYFRSLWD